MKLSMIVLTASMAYGAVGNLQVRGVTSTQAILAYRAPDTNPCSIEVSESPSYRPLAHDVDPALFAGADQDNRDGTTSGLQRVYRSGQETCREGDGRQVVFASAAGVHHSLLSDHVRRKPGDRELSDGEHRAWQHLQRDATCRPGGEFATLLQLDGILRVAGVSELEQSRSGGEAGIGDRPADRNAAQAPGAAPGSADYLFARVGRSLLLFDFRPGRRVERANGHMVDCKCPAGLHRGGFGQRDGQHVDGAPTADGQHRSHLGFDGSSQRRQRTSTRSRASRAVPLSRSGRAACRGTRRLQTPRWRSRRMR